MISRDICRRQRNYALLVGFALVAVMALPVAAQWTPTNPVHTTDLTANVGIGTSSPGSKLDIRGTTHIQTNSTFLRLITSAGNFGVFDWGGGGPNDRFIFGAAAGKRLSLGAGGQIDNVLIETTGTVNFQGVSTLAKFNSTVTGSVVPYGVFDWGGGGGIDRFIFYAATGKTLSFGANGFYDHLTVNTAGNVGAGTALPSSRLHVAGDLRFGSNGTNTDLRIFTDTPATINGTAYAQVNSIQPVSAPTSGTIKTALYLRNGVNGAGLNEIDFIVDGNIAAKYQDVAEWVPSNEDLQPGTVVVLSTEASNLVKASNVPYDTRVAGIVSEQPGVLLGVASATKEKVATFGRVKVRVDASAGAIGIGDLLVTGNKIGTAMKSVPIDLGGIAIHRPGTIIGKALEPLASGTGEILVLLSMQ